jgi:hypothetical protein
MSDLTALIARADYALGLEDHLWTDWRALVIDLRDALTAAEAQRRTVEQELEDANQQLTVLRPGGTYAWKTRAEAAEQALAICTQERDEWQRLAVNNADTCARLEVQRKTAGAACTAQGQALTTEQIIQAAQDTAKWNHCGQSKYHRTDNGRIVCQKLVDVSGDPR